MTIPINLRTTGSVLVVEGQAPLARMNINVPLTASSISVDSANISGDVFVGGTLTALEFKTTVVSSSIVYRSGSTKFGDSPDDVHEFTGSIKALDGLSGSLTQLIDGRSYIVAGDSVFIQSQSNGQIVIGSWAADVSASYVTLNATGSLPNERALSASFGLLLVDNGAGSTISFSVNDDDVATLSGSTFRGPVSASGGLTGSLQLIAPNLSYLVGAGNISVTTQSNGQVVVGVLAADVSASYIVIGQTGSLPNERALSASFGLRLLDNGAGSTATIEINDNEVATLSGSTFTGALIASGGLTGSLQYVSPGVPYLIAGNGIQVVTQSNDSVLITASTGSLVSAGYAVPREVKNVIVSGTAGHVTMSLTSDPFLWEEHFFKDADGQSSTNNIIISASAGHRIDGGFGHEISASYGYARILFVGDGLWSLIG